MFEYTVRSKCTALLNWKHGRCGRIWALASAHVLCLTTIMCPSISDSILEIWKLIWKWSIALEQIEHRVQMEARVYSGSVESEFGNTEWAE